MSSLTLSPIVLRSELHACEVVEDDRWDVCAYSARSPAKRTCNEDAAAVVQIGNQAMVAIVADGCGGMRGGEVASQLAIRKVVRAVRRGGDEPRYLRSAILDGIEQANEAIQSLKIGAACTLAVIECHRDRIRSYHVGDAMVVVVNRRGQIRYQSLCHSPVSYAVESGLLGEDEAMHHEDRHLVSNLVGRRQMRIEVGPWIGLLRRDRVVIASDGLFDNLALSEIARRLRASTSAHEGVRKLTQLASRRMRQLAEGVPSKPDDLTVISLFRRA